MIAFAGYDPEVWRVQYVLSALGMSPGAIDGYWGSNTYAAVTSFRAANGLPDVSSSAQGDLIDDALIASLQSAALANGISWPDAPASPGGSISIPASRSPVASNPLLPTAPAAPSQSDLPKLIGAAAVGLGFLILVRGK